MSLVLKAESTVKEALQQGRQALLSNCETPDNDVQILLSYILECSKLELIKEPDRILNTEQIAKYLQLIERRVKSEPIAYIIGYKEFYGHNFIVNPRVLCPRPETELLVELALKSHKFLATPVNLLDLGCGSGCIAISLAIELNHKKIDYSVWAVDRSAAAIEVAQLNAANLSAKNITFIESNWFSAFCSTETFNLIISNPPYVEPGKGYSPELKFEPQNALYAEQQGYADIFRIISGLEQYLANPGIFLCEIGAEQGAKVLEYAKQNLVNTNSKFELTLHQDLAGHDRVFQVKRSAKA